jgi:SnoaL-like domain
VPVNGDDIVGWVERYRVAWESNDPTDIGKLFAAEAIYRTEPYAQPWRGREEIVQKWLNARDEPGTTEFSFEPLARDETSSGVRHFIQGRTVYKDPARTYSNLWVIVLDSDGRCVDFTEWWMKHR